MHRIARMSAAAAATGVLLAAAALQAFASAPEQAIISTRIATFFSRLNAQPDNYARLRYASLRRSNADAELRHVVDQILATEWSMFGRIADADAGLRVSEKHAPSAASCP